MPRLVELTAMPPTALSSDRERIAVNPDEVDWIRQAGTSPEDGTVIHFRNQTTVIVWQVLNAVQTLLR